MACADQVLRTGPQRKTKLDQGQAEAHPRPMLGGVGSVKNVGQEEANELERDGYQHWIVSTCM